MNDEFLNKALSELYKADKVIIGLSGGADSVCLTHILQSKLGSSKLICAHVDHGIRGDEALRDLEFARSFSQSLGIEFKFLRADIPAMAKETGMGQEECGRLCRYRFFESLGKDNYLIATAHNADDNAETLIMNLMRGCGTNGMCGIPFKRGNIIRPILSLTREEIEEYCSVHGLSYVTDSTNLENDYLRNKVRHKVLSELKALCPEFTNNCFSATRIVSDDNEYLDNEALKLIVSIKKENYYDVSAFDSLGLSMKRRAVSLILKENGVHDLTSYHISKVISAIENNSSLSVPGNMIVNVKQNALTVQSAIKEKLKAKRLIIGQNRIENGKVIKLSLKNIKNNEKIHNLLFNISLDYDKISGYIFLSARKEGDKFTFPKRNVTKSLKKIFNEMKIPASLRDSVMILRDEKDNILFIEGVGVNKKYAADAASSNILTVEISKENS